MKNRIAAMRDRLSEVCKEQGGDKFGIPRFMGEVSQLLYDLDVELQDKERVALTWKIKAREWERDCWAARRKGAATELVRATNLVYQAEQEKR